MPDASRTRSLARNKKAHELVTTGPPQRSAFPARMVLRLSSSSPPGIGFLAPVIGATPKHRRQLDLGIERSGPHDFAVRSGTFVQRTASVHRIPRPTSVTIAKRPSLIGRGTRGKVPVICPSRQANAPAAD